MDSRLVSAYVALMILLMAISFIIGYNDGARAERQRIAENCELIGRTVLDGMPYACYRPKKKEDAYGEQNP